MISHLYRRPKKDGVFWFDARDDEHRWRESLETRDRHEAEEKLRERLQHLEANKAPDPAKRVRSYREMDVEAAVEHYATARRGHVSPRMLVYWKEQARPLAKFFADLKLKRLTAEHLADYQNARLNQNKAPKTINGEVSVLRQLLKAAKLWYRFQDYKAIPNNKPPVGRAISEEEQQRLFETAALWRPDMPKLIKVGKDGKTYEIRPNWMFAYGAATLAFYLGMRSVEIRHLKWKDINFDSNLLNIRHSKTPAGWRTPRLNGVCRTALLELYNAAKLTPGTEPEHFIFPARGTDPTRPMKSWRSAWRSLRSAAGLEGLRMHDGRHSAVTTMAEKGIPDRVIEAQVGHSKLLKDYLHIRRQALDAASASLEPTWAIQQQPAAENKAEMVN